MSEEIAVTQPMIVFDHVKRTVQIIGGDPTKDRRLAELLEAQKKIASSSSSGQVKLSS